MSDRPQARAAAFRRVSAPIGALLAMLAALFIASGVRAATDDGQPQELAHARAAWRTVVSATLLTDSDQRPVSLPYKLQPGDFPPEGGLVRFRMRVDPGPAADAPAIYIRKMSRSGSVRLNGHDLGACGPVALERLRCLHQPQLFRTDAAYWQPGENLIEVVIYANRNQANGLSALVIGPVEQLYFDVYSPAFLLQVESIDALNWLMLGLAMLSLTIYAILRTERLYLWFGLTCALSGLSNLNVLVIAPRVELDLFDWFIFSIRLMYTCSLGLTFLSFFGRDRPAVVRLLVGYALASPAMVWLFDNDPSLISLLYLPLQAMAIGLAVAGLIWARRSRRFSDWVMAISFLIMPVAGVLDLLRISGQSGFIGVYVLTYTSTVTLVLVGISMIGVLAVALRTNRDLSSILRQRIDESEARLRDVYGRVIEMEQARVRTEERERMVRDMHDGFMSTLAITRVALSTGRSSVQQAAKQVGDCLDDLRLVLDASASTSGSLQELIADFQHRFDGRIASAGIEPCWEVLLDGVPPLPPSALLQVMRIVQEAVNNAIRHAGARTITVRALAATSQDGLMIEIIDDGQGFQPGDDGHGRGLVNMRGRALTLGGALVIESAPGRTCVRLTLPAVNAR